MLILAEGRLSTRSRHCFRGNRTSNVPEQYASLLAPAPPCAGASLNITVLKLLESTRAPFR